MSLSMFSAIPAPFSKWDDDATNLLIPFFPAVGGVIGGLWLAAACFLRLAGLPTLLMSTLVMLVPFLLSGFLHVDGYMDTCDAVFSRRDISEKRRILKDSHVGAFAVIALCVLLLLSFAGVYTVISESKSLLGFVFIPVFSRGIVGIVTLKLKLISENGYAALFRLNTKPVNTVSLIFSIVVSTGAAAYLGGLSALIPLGVLSVTACLTTVYVYKQLDGISGDLCGCILTVSELIAVLAMAIL